ncbi:MAG TPA: ECF transporter S component [Candidatus Gallacutalibacter stercoravium]|nr:ECF transporter S component [Candidatus Gallacutalibacter stercoravium]
MSTIHSQNRKHATIFQVALTGMMAALVFVATMFIKVDIPLPTGKTMLSLGNTMCVLSGLLLGPIYGGLAGGLGSFCYDLLDPVFISGAPITFLFKFAIGFVCGLIAYAGRGKTEFVLTRNIVAAVCGAVAYMILYLGKSYFELIISGSAAQAALVAIVPKIAASSLNALAAVVIAVPLALAVRKALQRAHLSQKLFG